MSLLKDICQIYKQIRKTSYGITNIEYLYRIWRMMERTKEQIDTKEIILFGSYADGTANKDSDIDLCIITQ